MTKPFVNPSQSAAIERWLIDCGENGLINETIVITVRVKTNNAFVPYCVIETDKAKGIISQIRMEWALVFFQIR